MKPTRPQDPIRWRDRDADAHALESRAALLADAARQVQPLAPRALSRVRSEVVAQRSRRYRFGGFGIGRLGVPARIAFAIGLVILCVTTAGGAKVLWRKVVAAARGPAPAAARAVDAADGASAARVSARAVAVEALPEDVPPPAVEAPPTAEPATEPPAVRETPKPRAARPALGSVAPSMPVEPPPAPVEPRAVASRRPSGAAAPQRPPRRRSSPRRWSIFASDNDARAALATLDRHAREFPHGVLETEALRTRVEAVIQLGDLKTALRILDGKVASTEALGADLTLTRAELRAAAGRFREALSDFTEVVDGAAGPLVAGGDERALYGRAVCLGRLAQDDRARADLLAYQKRFPEGRFALEVKRLLAGRRSHRRRDRNVIRDRDTKPASRKKETSMSSLLRFSTASTVCFAFVAAVAAAGCDNHSVIGQQSGHGGTGGGTAGSSQGGAQGDAGTTGNRGLDERRSGQLVGRLRRRLLVRQRGHYWRCREREAGTSVTAARSARAASVRAAPSARAAWLTVARSNPVARAAPPSRSRPSRNTRRIDTRRRSRLAIWTATASSISPPRTSPRSIRAITAARPAAPT